MVRAPSPVAIGGMTDILLFVALDDGVPGAPGVPLLLFVLLGPREGSGVLEGVKKGFSVSCFETWPGFAFAFPVFPTALGSSCPLASISRFAMPIFKPTMSFCSLLDFLTPTLGRLLGDLLSDGSGSMKVPGPIDFRGGLVLAFVLVYELGGK